MNWGDEFIIAAKPFLECLIPIFFVADLCLTQFIRKKKLTFDFWIYKLNLEYSFNGMYLLKTLFAVGAFASLSPPYGGRNLGVIFVYMSCTSCFFIEFFRFINKRKKEMGEGKSTDMEQSE